MTGLADRLAARKDFLGGLVILVMGLATAQHATGYPIGSLRRMGPGFFPLSLGVILAATGVLLMLTARAPASAEAGLAPEWRGWAAICAGVAAFVVLGQWGGLVPATFAVVVISALGDRDNTVRGALLLGAVMTAVCVAVFWWLLQVPFPLFRWG